MKRIELVNTEAGWIARFINDPEVLELFDTDTLPTPFGSSTGWATVLNAVKRLNPDHDVVIG